MIKPKLILTSGLLFGLLATASLQAQAPELINYQGKLIIGGNPVQGSFKIVFTIYDDSTGGARLWSEEHQRITATNGIFNVLLGSGVPLAPFVSLANVLKASGKRFMAMKVGDQPESVKRARIASVAYAIKALSANALDSPDGSRPNAVFVDNAGHVGIGTTQPTEDLELSSTGATGIKITSTAANTKLNFAPGGSFGDIFLTTVDGKDTKALRLGGGGDVQTIRGAVLELRGNENDGETNAGDAILSAGDGGRLLLSNGNVGIGTAIPKEKLDVQGNMAISGTVNGIDVKNHVHNLEYGFSQSNVLQSSSNLSFADTDASVTINADGASAYLVQVSCAVGQSLTDRLVTVGIFRGETLLHDARQRVQFPEPLVNESVSLLHVDVPPAGPQVYKIRFRPSNDGIGYITDKRLVVMKLKTTAP